jgi:hypothetical protein
VGGFIVAFSFDSIFYVSAVAVLLIAALVHHGFPHRPGSGASTPRTGSDAERLRSSAIFEAMKDRRMAWFTLALFPTALVFFPYESTLPRTPTSPATATRRVAPDSKTPSRRPAERSNTDTVGTAEDSSNTRGPTRRPVAPRTGASSQYPHDGRLPME